MKHFGVPADDSETYGAETPEATETAAEEKGDE